MSFFTGLNESLYISSLISWNYLCHLCGRERYKCIVSIVSKLTTHNPFYAKYIQGVASQNSFFTIQESNYINNFTDNYNIDSDDIYNISEKIAILNQKIPEPIILQDINPIKSGIIGTVYYGKIKDKDIVIKMKRPNIKERLESGIMKLKATLKTLTTLNILSIIDLANSIEEVKTILLDQTDFDREIKNMDKFKKAYKYNKYIVIPDSYPDITEKDNDIIVMSRIRGLNISELSDIDKTQFVDIITELSFTSIFINNFWHGDLHRGNIFFIKDTEETDDKEETDDTNDTDETDDTNDTEKELNGLDLSVIDLEDDSEHESMSESEDSEVIDVPKYRLGLIDFGIVYNLREEEVNIIDLFFQLTLDDDNTKNFKLRDNVFTSFFIPKDNYINLHETKKYKLWILFTNICKDSIESGGYEFIKDFKKYMNLPDVIKSKLQISPHFANIQWTLSAQFGIMSDLTTESYNPHKSFSKKMRSMIQEVKTLTEI